MRCGRALTRFRSAHWRSSSTARWSVFPDRKAGSSPPTVDRGGKGGGGPELSRGRFGSFTSPIPRSFCRGIRLRGNTFPLEFNREFPLTELGINPRIIFPNRGEGGGDDRAFPSYEAYTHTFAGIFIFLKYEFQPSTFRATQEVGCRGVEKGRGAGSLRELRGGSLVELAQQVTDLDQGVSSWAAVL